MVWSSLLCMTWHARGHYFESLDPCFSLSPIIPSFFFTFLLLLHRLLSRSLWLDEEQIHFQNTLPAISISGSTVAIVDWWVVYMTLTGVN